MPANKTDSVATTAVLGRSFPGRCSDLSPPAPQATGPRRAVAPPIRPPVPALHGRRGGLPSLRAALHPVLALLAGVAAAEPKPPLVPPYQIPTFREARPDFKAVPPLAPAPSVDSDAVFRVVVNCFPERVQWGVELDVVGGARYVDDNQISTFDTAGLARYYVGVVAKMPLYSATELNRERAEEYSRRAQVADNLRMLLQALADRRRAQREIGLYSSLEARSQQRVGLGIVGVDEQVGYLEKVAQAQATLDDAAARIEGARMALVGQCRDGVADEVNRYLTEITK